MQVDPAKLPGADPRQAKKRWWLWFLAGFLVVFVGMLFMVTRYSMHPSGEAVVACKLWQYYLIEIRRAMTSSRAVGPASGSGSAAIITLIQHLLFSVAGGAAMMGIGWLMSKVKSS